MNLGDTTAVPIAWLAALILCAGSATAFIFSTFKTKEDAAEDKKEFRDELLRLEGAIHIRLTRMEDKLDRVLEED